MFEVKVIWDAFLQAGENPPAEPARCVYIPAPAYVSVIAAPVHSNPPAPALASLAEPPFCAPPAEPPVCAPTAAPSVQLLPGFSTALTVKSTPTAVVPATVPSPPSNHDDEESLGYLTLDREALMDLILRRERAEEARHEGKPGELANPPGAPDGGEY